MRVEGNKVFEIAAPFIQDVSFATPYFFIFIKIIFNINLDPFFFNISVSSQHFGFLSFPMFLLSQRCLWFNPSRFPIMSLHLFRAKWIQFWESPVNISPSHLSGWGKFLKSRKFPGGVRGRCFKRFFGSFDGGDNSRVVSIDGFGKSVNWFWDVGGFMGREVSKINCTFKFISVK